ncbi:iron complex outermembrane receptor protein [Variovorax sp. TBS-050B]|uniref:TonB-dependent receptor n=1 Tax=Variovorax sp. TBS-050B TaxID=2940551 RepID=UPI0024772A1C|nr:TonB-dependent receptor [Variovorax sp. TBS-050B]MDH6590714.1 iron complex outermembrane receptor protein [Variovorax sp. TBS-050B]
MPRISSARPLGLLVLLGAAGAPAAAQQPAAAPALPPVEVVDEAPRPNGRLDLDTPADTASRLGLTPRETPASVTVVNRAAIEARGAQNTQEILRAIPGVTAHDAPGNIGVSYRGFGSNSIGQLFNGINLQYSIAARPVDSWIYDRVEAIGGPSSFLFGSGALGGSVNYITKTAEAGNDFAEAQLRLGTQKLREASFGLNRRIAGEGGAGSHHARIDVNQRDADGWTDGTRHRATQLAASLLSDLGGGLRHTLAYEFQRENVERPYWGTPALNPVAGTMRIDPGVRFRNYNSSDGLYAQRVQWLRSVTEWQANETLQLRNTFYAYDALRDYRNVENYRYNPANTAVIRSAALLQRHDQEVWGNRIEGLYQGRVGALKSDWSFGLDFSENRQTRFPNSLPGTVSTVNPYVFATERFFEVPGMVPGFRPDRNNRVRTTALYLENRTALAPALHLVTALRHERIDLDLVNRRTVDAANPASFHRGYAPTTGRFGLVWDFAPGASLYAQYATAADPPSGVLSTASFADVRNNSELTTGRQVELGTKLDFWQGKGSATLAAYDIRRKNIATQDPANSALTVLVGEQSSRGVELALGLQPTPRWSLQGNLSYVDARYERFVQGGVSLAGRTPTNTPAVVANLWVSYAFTPELQASVGVRHVGKVYADAANTVNWPGYTLLDLGLSWKVNRAVTLVGRIRNATDRLYAANVGTAFAYLGAPRTADLSLRVAF